MKNLIISASALAALAVFAANQAETHTGQSSICCGGCTNAVNGTFACGGDTNKVLACGDDTNKVFACGGCTNGMSSAWLVSK